MSDGLIRSLVFVRTLDGDAVARVLIPHPNAARPFERSSDRWRSAVTRGALGGAADILEAFPIPSPRGAR